MDNQIKYRRKSLNFELETEKVIKLKNIIN